MLSISEPQKENQRTGTEKRQTGIESETLELLEKLDSGQFCEIRTRHWKKEMPFVVTKENCLKD